MNDDKRLLLKPVAMFRLSTSQKQTATIILFMNNPVKTLEGTRRQYEIGNTPTLKSFYLFSLFFSLDDCFI